MDVHLTAGQSPGSYQDQDCDFFFQPQVTPG